MTVNLRARRVLLLNQGCQVLDVVSIRHAVGLLMRKRAVAVTSELAAKLRTPSGLYPVPSVLRLKYFAKAPQLHAKFTKSNIMKRDAWTCIYCGSTVGDIKDGERLNRSHFTLEHIIPRSQGGKDTWSNCACACHSCNHRKADRTANQAGMKLLWEPKRPRRDYLLVTGEVPDDWKVWLQI